MKSANGKDKKSDQGNRAGKKFGILVRIVCGSDD